MKMHLPLGLRRALFNTFLAMGAVAAMSTAQAADFTNPGTRTDPESGAETQYDNPTITQGKWENITIAADKTSTAEVDLTATGTVTVNGKLVMDAHVLEGSGTSNTLVIGAAGQITGAHNIKMSNLNITHNGTPLFTITSSGDRFLITQTKTHGSTTDAKLTHINEGKVLLSTNSFLDGTTLKIFDGSDVLANADQSFSVLTVEDKIGAKLDMGGKALTVTNSLTGKVTGVSKFKVANSSVSGTSMTVTGTSTGTGTQTTYAYTLSEATDLDIASGTFTIDDNELTTLTIGDNDTTNTPANVTVGTSSMSVGNLTIQSDSTLGLGANTLTITGTGTVNGTLNVDSGILTIGANANVMINGTLDMGTGIISNLGGTLDLGVGNDSDHSKSLDYGGETLTLGGSGGFTYHNYDTPASLRVVRYIYTQTGDTAYYTIQDVTTTWDGTDPVVTGRSDNSLDIEGGYTVHLYDSSLKKLWVKNTETIAKQAITTGTLWVSASNVATGSILDMGTYSLIANSATDLEGTIQSNGYVSLSDDGAVQLQVTMANGDLAITSPDRSNHNFTLAEEGSNSDTYNNNLTVSTTAGEATLMDSNMGVLVLENGTKTQYVMAGNLQVDALNLRGTAANDTQRANLDMNGRTLMVTDLKNSNGFTTDNDDDAKDGYAYIDGRITDLEKEADITVNVAGLVRVGEHAVLLTRDEQAPNNILGNISLTSRNDGVTVNRDLESSKSITLAANALTGTVTLKDDAASLKAHQNISISGKTIASSNNMLTADEGNITVTGLLTSTGDVYNAKKTLTLDTNSSDADDVSTVTDSTISAAELGIGGHVVIKNTTGAEDTFNVHSTVLDVTSVNDNTQVNSGSVGYLTLDGVKKAQLGDVTELEAGSSSTLELINGASADAGSVTIDTLTLGNDESGTEGQEGYIAASTAKLHATDKVTVGTLNVMSGSTLTADVSVVSTAGTVEGKIIAQDINIDGTVSGAADLEASQLLDLTGATVATEKGSILQGKDITFSKATTADSSVTDGHVYASNSLDAGNKLTIDGTNDAGDRHYLGNATGTNITLKGGAAADAASVNLTGTLTVGTPAVGDDPDDEDYIPATTGELKSVGAVQAGTLNVAADSTVQSDSNISATTGSTIAGTVTSVHGDVSLGATTITNGANVTAAGKLTVGDGTATGIFNLKADTFTNTDDFTMTGAGKRSELAFNNTVVGLGTTLTITETSGNDVQGSLGNVLVSGVDNDGNQTTLVLNTWNTGLSGNITVEKGATLDINADRNGTQNSFTGDIAVNGTGSTATIDGAGIGGSISISGGGSVSLTNSDVTGNVTLAGLGDTLNMKNSDITGTLSVGNGSTVNVDGTNTAGSMLLDEGSILNWTEGATLTLTDGLVVDGDSTANVGQNGLDGDIIIKDGTLNLGDEGAGNATEGGVVDGDITMGNGADADQDGLINVQGDYTMDADEKLTIRDGHGTNTINMENYGTLTVTGLAGDGDVTLTGTGNVVFAGGTATTDASTGSTASHTGDIVSELGMYSQISATAQDSLGTGGALKLNTPLSFLSITADQKKDITIADDSTALLSTEGTRVELSGAVTGDTLSLSNADVTLSNAANDLEMVQVAPDSRLTTTAGNYDVVENNGIINMSDSTIGSLVNNTGSMFPSTVDGGSIGDIDNQRGELTVTGSTVMAGSDITNSDVLTLDGVTNEADALNHENDHLSVAGTLENADGTLTVTGSTLDFTTISLGGDSVTVADSTLEAQVAGSEAADAGTVNISAPVVDVTGSSISSEKDMVVEATATDVSLQSSQLNAGESLTVAGNIAMSGTGSSLNSGSEGTAISGSVTGTGDITSAGTIDVSGNVGEAGSALVGNIDGGQVDITGTVNVQGDVTASIKADEDGTETTGDLSVSGSDASLTVTDGDVSGEDMTVTDGTMTVTNGTVTAETLTAEDGDVAITGNGTLDDETGSTLGTVELTDGATLTLSSDDFSYEGGMSAEDSTVSISNAVTTGDIEATDSTVTLTDVTNTGDIETTDSIVTLTDVTNTGDIEAIGGELTLEDSTHEGRAHTWATDVTMQDSEVLGQMVLTESSLVLEGDNLLDASTVEGSVIDGTIDSLTGGATLTKRGTSDLKLSGEDIGTTTAKDSYTVHVQQGSLTLDNTARKGTIKADADTDIIVEHGVSTVGDLVVYGNGEAHHAVASNEATRVHIKLAGQDSLASATGEQLSAFDASGTHEPGTRGAQIVIDGWAKAPAAHEDGEMLTIAEGISGFDKEIVHKLDTQNVNLVEVTDENGITSSYAAVNINHKGATKNEFQQGVSDAIVSVEALNPDGQLADMLEALRHTTSEGGALAALDRIGGGGIATTMAAQMSANRDHMRTLRHSIGQPEPLPYNSIIVPAIRRTAGTAKPHEQQLQFPTRLWGSMTGSSSHLDTDSSGGLGYERHDVGFLVGSDVTLSNRSLVGLAAGYNRSQVEALHHTGTGDQYFVDLYGRVNTKRLTQSFTFGVGFFDWALEHPVYVRTADLYRDFYAEGKGQTKGMALNFSYEAAYNFQLKERHTLAPVFQLESSYNHINGYRESGTLGNAGLNVKFDNTFVTTLGLGVRYNYEFDGFGTAESKGSVSARAMLIGDVGDVNGTMTASFIGGGQHFEGESTKISRQGLLFGVDAIAPVSKHWAVFGSADFEIRDEYRDISAGIGARYTF